MTVWEPKAPFVGLRKMSTLTQKQLAASLDVSQAAVSCILSGKTRGFNPQTVRRVKAAAKTMNYHADHNARGLVQQRSHMIGLLVSQSESGWVIPDIVAGVQDVCDQHGYSIVFYSHSGAEDEETHCRNCVNRRVEALIVSGTETRENADQILNFQRRGIPIVEVFNHSIPSLPAVRTDMYAAGRMAGEHLLSLGHRRIAHFTHDRYMHNPDARAMWEGFSGALTAAGVAPRVHTSELTAERPLSEPYFAAALASARAWMAQPDRPTAIWCYNSEHQAQALLWACRELGIDVPREVSVMGFNDILFLSPGLTTLKHPLRAIGRCATQRVMDMLADKPVSQDLDILLEPEFIARVSTVAPADIQ